MYEENEMPAILEWMTPQTSDAKTVQPDSWEFITMVNHNAAQRNIGRILTVIESLGFSEKQEKAIKSQIKDILWATENTAHEVLKGVRDDNAYNKVNCANSMPISPPVPPVKMAKLLETKG